MTDMQKTITPVDGSIYAERPYASAEQISVAINRSAQAQSDWKHTTVAERAEVLSRFVDHFVGKCDVGL